MSTVYVISESDREQLIKWLNGLPSATLNQPAPAQEEAPESSEAAPEAAPAQEEEQAVVAVESQT